MKIAVVCANGKEGRLVVKEALGRGHDVTAVVRGENRSSAPKAVIRDIMDVTADDLAGFDVVVDAFGAWASEALPLHTASLMHLCDALSGTQTHLIVVGGAGSLYVDPEHTVQLVDTPEFPDEYRPLANAQREELAALRGRDDVRWTFVSPAADFRPDGPRTGSYVLAGEELTFGADGASAVSYADYAVAVVDEAERTSDAHVRERVSVRWA